MWDEIRTELAVYRGQAGLEEYTGPPFAWETLATCRMDGIWPRSGEENGIF